MGKQIKFFINAIKPSKVTIGEFITFLFNIFTIVLLLFKPNFLDLNDYEWEFINRIINIEVVNTLFIITLVFKIIDFAQMQIRYRKIFDSKHNSIEWHLLTYRMMRLFVMALSLYLFVTVLLGADNMKIEFNGYLEIGLFIFYVFVAFINFLSFIKTLFEEDNSYEKVYEKKEYLKNTIEKYEGRELDEINKRIALLTLYELTSKQYDKGLKLDEKEFRRNQYQNINKGK